MLLCCTCGDRLQFRLPDGSCQTHQFPATAALAEVYSWVGSSLQQPGASLSTSFPRRQLDTEERSSSLQQLGLAPSATLLVLPSTGLASQVRIRTPFNKTIFLNILLSLFVFVIVLCCLVTFIYLWKRHMFSSFRGTIRP